MSGLKKEEYETDSFSVSLEHSQMCDIYMFVYATIYGIVETIKISQLNCILENWTLYKRPRLHTHSYYNRQTISKTQNRKVLDLISKLIAK